MNKASTLIVGFFSTLASCNSNLEKRNIISGGKCVIRSENPDSLIPVFVHGYTGNDKNGQGLLLELDRINFDKKNTSYVEAILPNNRESSTASIEQQGLSMYEDLASFLLDNKSAYTNLYKNNKVPIELIAFSQGFQVSICALNLFLKDERFNWIEFGLTGVCPVAEGVTILDIFYGDAATDFLFPIEGPLKRLIRKSKETTISQILNKAGRLIGISGLFGLNAGDCRNRLKELKDNLEEHGSDTNEKIKIIRSSCDNGHETLPPMFVGDLGKSSIFQKLYGGLLGFFGRHDGLLSLKNQGEDLSFKWTQITGNHLDMHVMNENNTNVKLMQYTDGNSYPTHVKEDKYTLLTWGTSDKGTACTVAKIIADSNKLKKDKLH